MENHLLQKATLYTQAFYRTPMNRQEAGVLYRSCFLPVLTYPLPATWLPDAFFTRVHQLSTSIILNKMGYHRNLLQTMVFAPWMIGGVGMCDLCHKMEVQQILILLHHMCTGTPLGRTMGKKLHLYLTCYHYNQTYLVVRPTLAAPWKSLFSNTNSGLESSSQSWKTHGRVHGYQINGSHTSDGLSTNTT